MKLTYISTYALPSEKAFGVQMVNMCAAFAEYVDVELIVPDGKEGGSDIHAYYGVPKTFTVKKIACRGAGKSGAVWYWVRTVSFLLNTRKYMRKNKPDVVYAREPMIGFFFKHFFLELHTLPKKTTFIHRFLWKRPRGVIALTSFIKSELVNAGVPAGGIHIAHDAVPEKFLKADTENEQAITKYNVPQDRQIVAYVGKYKTPFGEGKGVDELIKSFARVQNEIPNAFLLLVGINKNLVEQVAEKCRSAGIKGGDVQVISHVPHTDAQALMRVADVLVMNYPWSEHHAYQMSPMKLFEYMAARKPIVASALPATCEIIDESMAHLIEPGNTEELREGIVKILSDESYARKLADNAYDHVKHHTWENRAKEIVSFMRI